MRALLRCDRELSSCNDKYLLASEVARLSQCYLPFYVKKENIFGQLRDMHDKTYPQSKSRSLVVVIFDFVIKETIPVDYIFFLVLECQICETWLLLWCSK